MEDNWAGTPDQKAIESHTRLVERLRDAEAGRRRAERKAMQAEAVASSALQELIVAREEVARANRIIEENGWMLTAGTSGGSSAKALPSADEMTLDELERYLEEADPEEDAVDYAASQVEEMGQGQSSPISSFGSTPGRQDLETTKNTENSSGWKPLF